MHSSRPAEKKMFPQELTMLNLILFRKTCLFFSSVYMIRYRLSLSSMLTFALMLSSSVFKSYNRELLIVVVSSGRGAILKANISNLFTLHSVASTQEFY